MATNMTFVDFVTPVPADWLNNVNTYVNSGANKPTTNQVNIGLSYTLVETAGATGNGIRLIDGAITAATATFTSASATFTSADVGKVIVVQGAGASGDVLYTTISAFVSNTSVTLATNASTTVSGATTFYGTNDSTAIQSALNNNTAVYFTPGKIYMVPAGLVVPTTCLQVWGPCSWVIGPSLYSGVAGFSFTNFYQGAGDIKLKSEWYVLPSVEYFTYSVYNHNSAFLRQWQDTQRNCSYGYYCLVDSASNYCFEMEMIARNQWHLRNQGNTSGGAFYMKNTGSAVSAYQGNHCVSFYVDDCWASVVQDSSGATGLTNGNINNVYDILECDQSSYAVYSTKSSSSGNLFRFPAGITSPGNSQMFINWNLQDNLEVLGVQISNPAIWAATNWEQIGLTNRLGIQVQSGGIPILWVNSSTGSDTTGLGTNTNPFATIQHAVNVFQSADLYNQTVYVYVQDGTYSAGATVQPGANGTIAIVGDPANPQNVVVNGTFAANGFGSVLEISGATINGGVLGQNGGICQIAPDIIFGASSTGWHISAQNAGQVQINSNYTVTGSATTHFNASGYGIITNVAATGVSCTGTISFTDFVLATNAYINVPGITFTGASVSGARYQASANGVINTNGGGASYFPGTTSGNTSSGGQYL